MDQARDVIVRFHEVALKGRNRPIFIRALVNNIRRATAGLGVRRVWSEHLLVRCTLEPHADWEAVRQRLARVSGAVKLCLAHRAPPVYDAIERLVAGVTAQERFASFRISARRADKSFSMTSRELNVRLGDLVRERSGARVDLTHPELEVHVEVLPDDAFVYTEEAPGAGGLPVGTGGRVATLMSGGIDSPVAAWRMVRRGCHSVLVHFHSFPLVEGRSREKAKELAELLNAFQYDTRLYLVPFADVQRQMLLSVPGAFRVVLYRRFMFRIAEAIARREKALALVTGESLGQVGSQTLQNITTIDEAVQMPVLRPLVGLDKQEITDQARAIGTYQVSILPDEDCCSLFVPKSPATRMSVAQVHSLEAGLDVAGLVEQAVAAAELFEYRYDPPEALASEPGEPREPRRQARAGIAASD